VPVLPARPAVDPEPRAIHSPRVFRAIGILALVLCACGQPGPYDRQQILLSPDGSYRVRYLAPPWEIVDAEGPPVILRIRSNAARFAGIDGAVTPRYELQLTVEGGDPMALARRDERQATSRGEEVTVPLREVETTSGDLGWEVVTHETADLFRYKRYTYLRHPRGALRLFFDGALDLAEREVDVMVGGVEILSE